MKDVFLGAITDEVVAYDNSGVVQPGSSTAPVDTSVVDTSVNTDVITPDEKKDGEDKPNTSNNAWILYLGVGIMAYVLLFKKK